jgi:ribosomal protein S12 methylthiotransferase
MVGFPGETEEDFNELMEFTRQARFDRMGAFAYCEEEGTFAANNYEDDVPEEVKQERLDRLMLLQEGISAELCAEKVGNSYKVVIDRKEGDYYIGRTEHDSPEVDCEVLIHQNEGDLQFGNFYNVTITAAEEYDLYGTLSAAQ